MIIVQTKPCVIASCDSCGLEVGLGDGETAHFESIEAARAGAADREWLVTDDGILICESCVDECSEHVACPQCAQSVGRDCFGLAGAPRYVPCKPRVQARLEQIRAARPDTDTGSGT